MCQRPWFFSGRSRIESRWSAAVGCGEGIAAINVNAAVVANGLTIFGNNGANVLTGTGPADTLTGNGGNDTYSGQPGRWSGHDLGERQYPWQQ
jgi:RTX calcium-binding nonapeptide repeat (4 copies)